MILSYVYKCESGSVFWLVNTDPDPQTSKIRIQYGSTTLVYTNTFSVFGPLPPLSPKNPPPPPLNKFWVDQLLESSLSLTGLQRETGKHFNGQDTVACRQGCGSGSAWILIHFPSSASWISICILYAYPDPGGKILRKKLKNARKLVPVVILLKNKVNLNHLCGF